MPYFFCNITFFYFEQGLHAHTEIFRRQWKVSVSSLLLSYSFLTLGDHHSRLFSLSCPCRDASYMFRPVCSLPSFPPSHTWSDSVLCSLPSRGSVNLRDRESAPPLTGGIARRISLIVWPILHQEALSLLDTFLLWVILFTYHCAHENSSPVHFSKWNRLEYRSGAWQDALVSCEVTYTEQ